MIAYTTPGCSSASCIVPFNGTEVGYVMIDPGTPLPHIYARQSTRQPTLGQSEEQPKAEPAAEPAAPTPPTLSNRQLLDELYSRNKFAFWLGGGVIGALALSGLFGLIKG